MRYTALYLRKLADGTLQKLADTLMRELAECRLCPHRCGVDRHGDKLGYCQAGAELEISGYGPHYGEELPLVGQRGSGTIFFSHCNLGCVYCQNWDTSQAPGEKISPAQLGGIMLDLQKQGCHNINLVTPSHYVPQIVAALAWAAPRGLCLPLVYNCGGYESLSTLQRLAGIIDIYMPDFKYADPAVGQKLSKVVDYWEISKASLKEMHKQVGDLHMDWHGIASRGLIIRHLILPARLAGTKEVMDFIATEISPRSYLNIMDQYYPAFQAHCYAELARTATRSEFLTAVRAAKEASREFRLAHEYQAVSYQ